ncbi:MAG: TRAP transporter TatT component family protein [Gammaproteobacteria bacterium]|nr:TRAP transporter TatT component family protein [Gammaproteobacteria bacterium]MCW9004269.1 TRAP transporter TatT component family protein [Gammaproteobacteria bacterium]MCW9055565.1 TRAP transporter TatT component family protein [Gammaproteobacteria bacterium]
MNKHLAHLIFLILASPILSGCSFAKLTVRASMPMIEGGISALNRESDLLLAEAAMPPNIELMEGMLINDPDNMSLRLYAAQAYYGYVYGFIEDTDRARASKLYFRGFNHGARALSEFGITAQHFNGTLDSLQQSVNKLGKNAVPALFWTASCWAKWIDMNRNSAKSLAQMPKAVMLMQRAIELDESFFMGSANLFFAVYYGSKPPMLGGDYDKSAIYFDRARKLNNDKLLLVDLLQAQYLDRQKFDIKSFHTRLNNILSTPDDIYPEQSLITMIAKKKARLFLTMDDQWF